MRIAIIDTGISPAAIPAENLSDGYNYIRPQDGTADKIGHGTALAGLIVGNEALGVEGVCPEAVLVPLVWCSIDETGKTVKGKTDMAAQAIYDAIDVYGCDIINLSSGSTSDSASLREAAAYAEEKGVLLVSSAGNDNETAPDAVYYPGAYESVLCVGSADGDRPADFSQRNDTVDLLAPGTSLRVLTIKGTRIRGDGTSYSTAIVSGVAARLLTEDPDLTAAELRALLTGAARDVGPAGYDTDSGWGILDPDAALAALAGNGEKAPAFSDASEDAWYYESVRYAVSCGPSGTPASAFSPNVPFTRQQTWMLLVRHLNK
ncbi:MAG: S8 family serine peptidase [Bacillota bacterium]|nr:S8 family serine peptidase [Bacillota bacterium]